MYRQVVIGVMGGANAKPEVEKAAFEMGVLIADHGWILLNGGRDSGVMAASARGAATRGGITVGILPGEGPAGMSEHISIPIFTGMGMARNCINVLSSTVVVAFPGGPGTISEIALALKYGRPVILVGFDADGFFSPTKKDGSLSSVATPKQAIDKIKEYLNRTDRGRKAPSRNR